MESSVLPGPERPSILERTYRYLRTLEGFDLRIKEVALNLFFTVMETAGGDVGACMSYYKIDPIILRLVQSRINTSINKGQDLGALLFSEPPPWLNEAVPPRELPVLKECLRATYLSALSTRVIREGGDVFFEASRSPADDPFRDVRRALVIGFGGFMKSLCETDTVEKVYVSDLGYRGRREEMDAFAARYKGKVVVSDGSDVPALKGSVDLVSITGSTLSNGTLEQLLDGFRASRVILQGQSAGIHPKALFEGNVELVVTTLKPSNFLSLAKRDVHGSHLKEFVESGRDTVYLRKRTPAVV